MRNKGIPRNRDGRKASAKRRPSARAELTGQTLWTVTVALGIAAAALLQSGLGKSLGARASSVSPTSAVPKREIAAQSWAETTPPTAGITPDSALQPYRP